MAPTEYPRQNRLFLFFHSIRFRLSLWFGLVLAVILIAFSLFIYYRQTQDAYNQAAARLAIRAGEMNLAFSRAIRGGNDDNYFNNGNSSGGPFTLHEGEVVILINRLGQITTFSGPIAADEAKSLAIIATQQEPNNNLVIYHIKSAASKSKEEITYLFITTTLGYEKQTIGWITLGQQLDPYGQLSRLAWTLLIAGLVTLAAALAGGYWLADRALRPVKTITRTAQAISESGLDRRLNLKSRDELGELAHTFDRMLDRLQAAFNRQRQFTADASHELRTPLTIIGLETGRALSGSRSKDELQQALQIIQSENKFMSRLVEELLTLARMDSGQLRLTKEPLDLSDLALDVTERFASLADQKGIELKTGDLPELTILGDRLTLAQMIANLVDNAIKYSPEGGGHWVCVETGSSDTAAAPTAWVRISDNGSGIAAEHLPHLFDRFYRVDSARSHNLDDEEKNIPGSGLGLAIVQWIVQIHDGTIQVTSQPGQGSTFEVHFPLPPAAIISARKASSLPAARQNKPASAASPRGRNHQSGSSPGPV
jgi:two-component system, OmpR family, sensor kinase